MQQLKEAQIQGNRIEVGDWFIYIKPYSAIDLEIVVKNKTTKEYFYCDTLEDAMEQIK